MSDAHRIFTEHDVKVTSNGARVLGSPVGSLDFIEQWVTERVKTWVDEIHLLATISLSQPQSVFSALTHGLMNRWTYLSRTCPNITTFLLPLEEAIRTVLLPSITGQSAPNDNQRDIFSIPCRLGGLGIPDPSYSSAEQYSNSQLVSFPLTTLVLTQSDIIPPELYIDQLNAKKLIRSSRFQFLAEKTSEVRKSLSPTLLKLFDIASEKGSSTWLSVLPLRTHGYHLHKGAFRDGLCLRYGWEPPHLPEACICGAKFNVDHAFNCPCGGFPSIRHNELRDITAALMSEVCHNVTIEPTLQPLSGETLNPRSAITEDDARSDVRAEGFWSCRQQQAYFDVKVFDPTTATYRNKPLRSSYRQLEAGKRRNYQDRIINVEHGSFSPLIFTTSGGMGPTATTVYKRLASLLSAKRDEHYSKTILYIRCQISFALLRSAIRCLRGSRSKRTPYTTDSNIELALSEGRVAY